MAVFHHLTHCLTDSQRAHYYRMERINCKKISTKKELYRRVLIGRDHITDNWQKQLSMEEVAKAASLSPFHFQRTFKAVFGLSPAHFARQVKLKKASQLLKEGGYTVKEIATILGYADGFSFSKAFKREMGVAPLYFQNARGVH